jgi:hypothetical protein
MLALHHQKQRVSVFQRWRSELVRAIPEADLKQHAVRTARAMGGLGSISEIALFSQDDSFTHLLDALYATCKQIRNAYNNCY